MCWEKAIKGHSKKMLVYKLGRKKPTLIAPSSSTSCLWKCEKVFLLFKIPSLWHLAKEAQANHCLSGATLPRGFECSLCISLLTRPFFSFSVCVSSYPLLSDCCFNFLVWNWLLPSTWVGQTLFSYFWSSFHSRNFTSHPSNFSDPDWCSLGPKNIILM